MVHSLPLNVVVKELLHLLKNPESHQERAQGDQYHRHQDVSRRHLTINETVLIRSDKIVEGVQAEKWPQACWDHIRRVGDGADHHQHQTDDVDEALHIPQHHVDGRDQPAYADAEDYLKAPQRQSQQQPRGQKARYRYRNRQQDQAHYFRTLAKENCFYRDELDGIERVFHQGGIGCNGDHRVPQPLAEAQKRDQAGKDQHHILRRGDLFQPDLEDEYIDDGIGRQHQDGIDHQPEHPQYGSGISGLNVRQRRSPQHLPVVPENFE